MAETKVFPDFHQDLTRQRGEGGLPEVGSEEKTKAAQSFNRTFDELMRGFQSEVQRGRTEAGQEVAQLSKNIEADGRSYDLMLTEVGEPPPGAGSPGEGIKRVINLQLLADGQPAYQSLYRFHADGVVRRYDIDAEVDQMRATMTQRDLQAATSPQEQQQRYAAAQQNYVENARFEEEMGVNNQPVSLDEIKGLELFLGEVNLPRPLRRSAEPSPYL